MKVNCALCSNAEFHMHDVRKDSTVQTWYRSTTAVADTVAHYDDFRARGALEHDARTAAQFYLRRKLPTLDAVAAAELLADALARRAAARAA